MEANTYNYDPSSSTLGIFYNEDDDSTSFVSRLHTTPFFLPCEQGADGEPTTICSTSDGLVAWHESSSNIYYISNPLIPAGPNSFVALQESPTRHPPHNTHVVLATDFSDCRMPVYHLICAIPHDTGCTFDTYTSKIGRWVHHGTTRRCDIVPNTGVSCGRFAFWLIQNPHSILRFDIDINNDPVKFWNIPVETEVLDMQETRMQLGRVNNQLGLVVADASAPSLDIFLMQNDEMYPYASMNFSISEAANWGNGVFGEGCFICREMPRPIRFQSTRMEVFLWVDGRLLRWVENSMDPLRQYLRITGEAGVQIVNGFSYVATWLLPGNFPRGIEVTDDQDDDHQHQNDHQDDEDQRMEDAYQNDHEDGEYQGIDDQDNGDLEDDHQDESDYEDDKDQGVEDQCKSCHQDGDDQ